MTPPRGNARLAAALLAFLAAMALAVFFVLPPIHQSPRYHDFADRRTLLHIPNFWNVITNAAFLAAAAVGWRAVQSPRAFIETWERRAYLILLFGSVAVAFGSAYYHLHPDSDSLFWDRLPMTVVFMSLFASTLGERFSPRIGKLLLFPLLTLGAASVVIWRMSDDLRLYGIVQFYPMIAIPLLLILLPPRYTLSGGLLVTVALYGVAKLLETFDSSLAALISTGGHPWKHLAAAGALLAYGVTVTYRRPAH
jgi:hypothetical protein